DDFPVRIPGRGPCGEVDVRDVTLVESNEARSQFSCRAGQQEQQSSREWIERSRMAGPRPGAMSQFRDDRERRRACRLVDEDDAGGLKRARRQTPAARTP